MLKTVLIILFLALLAPQCRAQPVIDTFRLYFDLNVPTLNKLAKKTLDSLVYHDRIRNDINILIVGYADYLGTEGYNKKLSETRAKNTAGYLKDYNVSEKNIKLCIGKGEIERTGHTSADGYPTDRRVDVVLQHTPAMKHETAKQPPKPQVVKNELPPVRTGDILKDIKTYKPGESFVLKNIYFLPERHAIREESLPALEELLHAMEDNPTLKIQIEGHVCCINGYPDAIDMDNGDSHLSVNRAKEIYYYLISKGIDKDRLKYVGYGHSRPVIIHEVTEEDANKNRRVEIRILER